MVDFTLTDEQRNLREMAHDFAMKEIRPVAWEYDKDGTWPADVLRKAGEGRARKSARPAGQGGGGRAHELARARGVRRAGRVIPRRMHHRGGAVLGLLRHHDVPRRQRP